MCRVLLELWHSRDKIPFATVPVDTHFENHEIRSRGLWLGHEFFKAIRAAASSQATEEALRHAESLALYRGKEREPFTRHGHEGGEVLYLDMCDDAWRAPRIAAGGWEVVANPAPNAAITDLRAPRAGDRFRRAALRRHRSARPAGDRGRDHDDHQLAGLNFHPNGPYPILDLYGVDGSAKGSTARRIKRFTDPDYLKDRPPPRDELGLCAMARNALGRRDRQPVLSRALAQRLHV